MSEINRGKFGALEEHIAHIRHVVGNEVFYALDLRYFH